MTLLLFAASRGHADAVELLLAHGADVNAKTVEGWTPLHRATAGHHRKVAKLLLTHNADVNATNNEGIAPWHIAQENYDKSMMELLLAMGANRSANPKDGRLKKLFGVKEDSRLFDVAKLTQLAGEKQCLICGGAMQRTISGFSLECSAGHEKLAYFAFDSSYCTQSKRIADSLGASSCRVTKAEGREQWNIFAPLPSGEKASASDSKKQLS